MSSTSSLFRKWRRWLERILNEQLDGLLTSRHVYHQLSNCLMKYEGTRQGAELAAWMQDGYVAFASTAIRRMVEEPNPRWKSVSLVIFLRDLQKNHTELTRTRFRLLYQGKVDIRHADKDFDRIVRRKGATCISQSRIERDIAAIKRVAAPAKGLVDKVVAHTEQDRRRVGKCTYRDLEDAVDLLENMFRRYRLLIHGSCPDPLVSLHNYNVVEHLRKIWP